MKAICLIFAMCSVLVRAEENGEASTYMRNNVTDVLEKLAQMGYETLFTLKYQIKEIALDYLERVEAEMEKLDILRADNGTCVSAENKNIWATADEMHTAMNECGEVAATTSAKIMTDIFVNVEQLGFLGHDLINLHEKCEQYNNTLMRKPCLSRYFAQVNLYSANAHISIKAQLENNKQRIPQVLAVANSCTTDAVHIALLKFNNIQRALSNCVNVLTEKESFIRDLLNL